MGTTALTTTRSECQPHACHVSFAKIYWGESGGERLQYLCRFNYKGKRGQALHDEVFLTFSSRFLDLRIHSLTQRSGFY